MTIRENLTGGDHQRTQERIMEAQYLFPTWIDMVTLSTGLLVARLVLGLYMAAHGAQKLFGWFGGYGLRGTAGFFEQLGFRPGRLFAAVAAGTELISGVLVALGLFGPIGPALMISVMIVAAGSVHWPHGAFATNNGVELPLLFASGAFALALTGPGAFSADVLFGLVSLWTAGIVWSVVGIGVVGGVANLMIRRPARASAPA
jgi:putative oxidoreductase